jgi:hypothetical protein
MLMLLVGVLGFGYASTRLSTVEPVPPGISVSEYTRYPAGRWELARFALAAVGGVGLLLALFPQGR